MSQAKNVLGGELKSCCTSPVTGFYRDGFCNTGSEDYGFHIVCIKASDEFLEFSKAQGNDLSTPRPEYGFPGLQAGNRWCLCVSRWQDALEAGAAPQVYLHSTHISALEHVSLKDLKDHALDLKASN